MDPVKIELKEGVKNKHKPATTAREVPIYYEKTAKEQIKKMVEEGVIVEVTEPTVFCSRSTFLPKSDGVSLRLVTDYGTINRLIARPAWPFTASTKLIEKVEANLPWVAAVDLLSGYHQVPLDKESSMMTCFITPFGTYRFLWAPMVLSPSGERFNIGTDPLSEGLENVLKLVDDVLFQAASPEKLEKKLDKFFAKCRE